MEWDVFSKRLKEEIAQLDEQLSETGGELPLPEKKEKGNKVEEKRIKRILSQKIEHLHINDDVWTEFVYMYEQGEMEAFQKEMCRGIESEGYKEQHHWTNSYLALDAKDREELFGLLEQKIKGLTIGAYHIAIIKRMCFPGTSHLAEGDWETCEHALKQLALFYYKGYVLTGNVKEYTLQALPFFFFFLEQAEGLTFENFYFPANLTDLVGEEQKEKAEILVKEWYVTRWKSTENLKERVIELTKGKRFERARHLFHLYSYLWEEAERTEIAEQYKQTLLECYQEVSAETNLAEKKKHLWNLKTHLDKFDYS